MATAQVNKMASKGDMDRHMAKHTGGMPYRCGECEYTTDNQSNLTKHNKMVHTSETPYKCDQCHFYMCGECE